jgi:LacI family transcriptional regulator
MTERARLTIRDVARTAGVSIGTVSRVLNRNSTVHADIRQRVDRAIDELGYTPSSVAQSMRSRTTQTIGCIIREISIPPLAAFVRAAHDVLHEAGYALLLTNSEGNAEREQELLRRLDRRQADGILLGHYSPLTAEFDGFLRDLNIPIVLVDRDKPAWADSVAADHFHSARRITDHLLSLGHRRIAIITGPEALFPGGERLRGYRAAHQERGVAIDPQLVSDASFLAKSGFSFMSGLLGQGDRPTGRPTAVIAGGIDMLDGVLSAIRARGLSIPQDISVVGAGDSSLAELHTPPISVSHWSQTEVGRIAAEMLLDRILRRATGSARHVLVPTEFVFRESTAPPGS